jgi:hypothetical protein
MIVHLTGLLVINYCCFYEYYGILQVKIDHLIMLLLCDLLQYFIFLCIIFLFLIIAGILAAIFHNQVSNFGFQGAKHRNVSIVLEILTQQFVEIAIG